jgi:hypothetical protein
MSTRVKRSGLNDLKVRLWQNNIIYNKLALDFLKLQITIMLAMSS